MAPEHRAGTSIEPSSIAFFVCNRRAKDDDHNQLEVTHTNALKGIKVACRPLSVAWANEDHIERGPRAALNGRISQLL